MQRVSAHYTHSSRSRSAFHFRGTYLRPRSLPVSPGVANSIVVILATHFRHQAVSATLNSQSGLATQICYWLLRMPRQEDGEFKACLALFTHLFKTEAFSLRYKTPKTWKAKGTIPRKFRKLQYSRNFSTRLKSGNSGERQALGELPTACSF